MQSPARMRDVFGAALRLGLTSFGGPVAHIGYFRREYVQRRGWLDEATFADFVALCQALPGPASSQLGIAIGTLRAGFRGGLAAWLGFTLPSAIALIAVGLVAGSLDIAGEPWVRGLKLAAVAIVAQAVIGMRRSLAPDGRRQLIAIAVLAVSLALPSGLTPLAAILGGAAAGLVVLPRGVLPSVALATLEVPMSRRKGAVALMAFAALLIVLPVLRAATRSGAVALADTFSRAGALVFGGGHVVLPVLHDAIVSSGWVDESRFLAGYGAAQAVPGPLFTFAGYLGAASTAKPNGIAGGLIALVAIFLPGALLIWGVLPFWATVRHWERLRRARLGVGAAVVGLLAAALYDPIWRSAVVTPVDAGIALAALMGLLLLDLPPLVVVIGCAVAAQLII